MMESKAFCYADFAIRDKRETLITYYKVFSLSLQARYTRIGRIYLSMYLFPPDGTPLRAPLTKREEAFFG